MLARSFDTSRTATQSASPCVQSGGAQHDGCHRDINVASGVKDIVMTDSSLTPKAFKEQEPSLCSGDAVDNCCHRCLGETKSV